MEMVAKKDNNGLWYEEDKETGWKSKKFKTRKLAREEKRRWKAEQVKDSLPKNRVEKRDTSKKEVDDKSTPKKVKKVEKPVKTVKETVKEQVQIELPKPVERPVDEQGNTRRISFGRERPKYDGGQKKIIYNILKQHDRPMTAKEVSEIMIENEQATGLNPRKTVSSIFCTNKEMFEKVGYGQFRIKKAE